MPRSRYRSLYLATAPGWAPSQQKKTRRGRAVESVCEDVHESNGETEDSAEEGSLKGEAGMGQQGVRASLAGHAVWTSEIGVE